MMITFLIKPNGAKSASVQLPPFGASWTAVVETLKQPKTALLGVGVDNFDVLFYRTQKLLYIMQHRTGKSIMKLSRSAMCI